MKHNPRPLHAVFCRRDTTFNRTVRGSKSVPLVWLIPSSALCDSAVRGPQLVYAPHGRMPVFDTQAKATSQHFLRCSSFTCCSREASRTRQHRKRRLSQPCWVSVLLVQPTAVHERLGNSVCETWEKEKKKRERERERLYMMGSLAYVLYIVCYLNIISFVFTDPLVWSGTLIPLDRN